MAKSRGGQQAARLIDAVVGHEQAARKGSDRTFQDTDVLVRQDMRYTGTVEQRGNGGDQDSVIGADELAHVSLRSA
jgi:hypothetical protein